MRFSPGCGCCGGGAPDPCCAGAAPGTLYVTVTAVSGGCASNFSVGPSWALPRITSTSTQTVYESAATTSGCGSYVQAFRTCGPTSGKYYIIVAFSGNSLLSGGPGDTRASGGDSTNAVNCGVAANLSINLFGTGVVGCCSTGTVTVHVTE